MSASLFRKFTSPSGSAASSPARCSSPSSPTRTSRLQEKEELIGLNNRLAVYIEKVRSLEQENSKLTTQIKSSQEVVTKEVTNIKTLYENELATARGIMDETAKERAKLQIDLGSAISDKEELTFKLRQKENDLKNLETTVDMQDTEISNLMQRLNKLNSDKKKDDSELKDLRSSVAKLRQQLDETRAQLESESLGRVDLMNRLQSQREDFDFKMNVYEEQLKESHSRTSFEISQVDGSLRSDYEDRLSTALHDLRAQYEQQMKANREEVEQLYELKLSELRGSHTRSQQSTSTTLKELRDTRARIESLNDRVNQLEATNASLLVRVRELETQLDGERAAGAAKDEHLSALEQRMQDQLQEYQDLMDTKLALDIEIAAYRKLLEAEEARLNISPLGKFGGGRSGAAAAAAASESPSLNRAGKRKRTLMEASASCSSSTTSCYQLEGASTCHGALEIVEECADGKFVRVRNNSDKEESLGGGQLVRSCVASSEQGDSRPDVEYKFPRTIRLGAGELCTVWSADAGVPHEPPHALVMRGQHWPMAEHFSTSLLDKNGEELAKRVTKRVSVIVGDMGENGQDHSENGSHSSDWKLLNIFGSKRATPRR